MILTADGWLLFSGILLIVLVLIVIYVVNGVKNHRMKETYRKDIERMMTEHGMDDPETTPWEFCLWGGYATAACSDSGACGCDALRPNEVKILTKQREEAS